MRVTLSSFFGATRFSLLLYFVSLSSAVFSQEFQEVPYPDFGMIFYTGLAYGDVDGDSDIDIIVSGNVVGSGLLRTRLYLNDGKGNFTESPGSDFVGVAEGYLKLVDIDSDNDLDLFVLGRSDAGATLKLYLNNGNGQFSELEDSPFPQVHSGGIGVADVNGDSSPDVLVAGRTENGLVAKLFLNNGQSVFTEDLNNSFIAHHASFIAFGDIEGDGDQDVVLSGLTDKNVAFSALYINESGSFTKVDISPFTKAFSGKIEFVDIDNDGDEDFLQIGKRNNGNMTTWLFFNDGKGVFAEDQDFTTEISARARIALGDIDNDVDKDIFLYDNASTALLLNNDGQGKFSENVYQAFKKLRVGSVAIAQFDGEGLDDILMIGQFLDSGPGKRLYVNKTIVHDPPIIGEISVSGELVVEEELSTFYSYSGHDENEDESIFRWYRSEDISGAEKQEILGADTKNYRLSIEDEAMYVQVEITPFDGVRKGLPVQSEWYGPVKSFVPEIQVKGNDLLIENGATTTTLENHTDFGAVLPGEVFTRVFKIGNSGRAPLALENFSFSEGYVSEFLIEEVFPKEVLPGEEANITITFAPTGIGIKNVLVQILSNDRNNANFQFRVSGKGINTPPIFLSLDSIDFLENNSDSILDVNAVNGEGGEPDEGISYFITGGADKDKFKIDQESGFLSFIDPPDFENPADADGDNQYMVQISADDGGEEDNLTFQDIVIKVIDADEMPIASCVATYTASLDENGRLSITADEINSGSSDDSGVFQVSIDRTDFSVEDLGQNEVVLTVTDANGNQASCSTIVNIKAATVPLKTKDTIVYLDALGKATISFEDVVTDTILNEEFGSFSVFPDSFTCADLGANTVTVTLIDEEGNNQSATAIVEVVERIKPEIKAVDEIRIKAQEGFYGAKVEIPVPEVSDNCGVKDIEGIRSDALPLTEIFPLGETKILWSAKDEALNSAVSVEQLVVVEREPSIGGSVTGGGLIISPLGAYLAEPTIVGKANFSINAKYKGGKNSKNEIGGSNTFQFKIGNLNFKSTSINNNSLVISEGSKAFFRGTGSINGKGNYEFIISVIDAQKTLGLKKDLFQIKIWGKTGVIYNTNVGTTTNDGIPTTEIESGSIVVVSAERDNINSKAISNNKGSSKKQEQDSIDLSGEKASEILSAFPNPLQGVGSILFTLDYPAQVSLNIYDLNARLISQLFQGHVEEGKEYEVKISSNDFMPGIYIYRLSTDSGKTYHKQLIIR